MEYICAHPDDAANIVAKAFSGDPKLYRKVFKHIIAVHYWTPGVIDKEGMDHMVESLRIMGQRKGLIDWDRIVDARFIGAKTN